MAPYNRFEKTVADGSLNGGIIARVFGNHRLPGKIEEEGVDIRYADDEGEHGQPVTAIQNFST